MLASGAKRRQDGLIRTHISDIESSDGEGAGSGEELSDIDITLDAVVRDGVGAERRTGPPGETDTTRHRAQASPQMHQGNEPDARNNPDEHSGEGQAEAKGASLSLKCNARRPSSKCMPSFLTSYYGLNDMTTRAGTFPEP